MAKERKARSLRLAAGLAFLITACAPTPGPDKSIAGAILGAAWGTGAGAVIGNQVDHVGPGAAIGAGFGAASGLLTGIGLDIAEGVELEQQRQLDALRIEVASNERHLVALRDAFDERQISLRPTAAEGEVYFDSNAASLRLGSAAQLERLADAYKSNPQVGRIEVHGHSDDTGDTERNRRLSEARARTVATFLSSHGVPLDQIKLYAHGAQRPIAGNGTDVGKQLNRRVEIVVVR